MFISNGALAPEETCAVSPRSELQLRPYQLAAATAAVDHLAAGRSTLLQGPTGCGKTEMLVQVCREFTGASMLILVHRIELVVQIRDRLASYGIHAGIIGDNAVSDDLIRVGTIQTVANRITKDPDALGPPGSLDLLIIDECHHATRETQYGSVVGCAAFNGPVLGLTATPRRLDGTGLGRHAGGHFDVLVCTPGIRALTADGFLVPATVYAPDATGPDLSGVRKLGGDFNLRECRTVMMSAGRLEEVVAGYLAHGNNEKAVAFCVMIDHAQALAAKLMAAGIPALAVWGGMPDADRVDAFAALKSGAIRILTSCDLIGEGIDLPDVGAVILARPTASISLYLQQIGRGLRVLPGKTRLIVLDHAGNTVRHGFITDDRDWTLDDIVKPGKGATGVAPMKTCTDCHALLPASTMDCPECGADLRPPAPVVTPRTLGVMQGGVTGAPGGACFAPTQDDINRICEIGKRTALSRARTYGDLLVVCYALGMNLGAAYHEATKRGWRIRYPDWSKVGMGPVEQNIREEIKDGFRQRANEKRNPGLYGWLCRQNGF